MVREFSAGGVVIRRTETAWEVAVIEPQRENTAISAGKSRQKRSQKVVLALPKGLVDQGEKPEAAALREVFEETGIKAVPVTKLGDIKYFYMRTWSDNERVFKIVSFYLLEYASGDIDGISPEMRVEVKRALWIPLEEAARKLSYRSEKEMVTRAMEYLKVHPHA